MKVNDVVVPESECARAVAAVANHNAMYQQAGGVLAPKHHLLWECAAGMHRNGNPRFYSTYADESFNGVIKRVAQTVHPRYFSERVLCKQRVLRICDGKA